MFYRYSITIIVIAFSLTIFSCGNSKEEQKAQFDRLSTLSEDKLDSLKKKSIFFGHKSTGYNIMAGVDDILEMNRQVDLKVIDTRESGDIKPGIFAHTAVGKNGDIESKLIDLRKILDSGVGKKLNIVSIKFCWADFMEDADVPTMFNTYIDYIKKIQKDYPELTVVHLTVPLTTYQSGIKAFIKKLAGKPPWGVRENVKRYEYNQLLLEKYKGKEPVFDVAKAESTYPDGTRSTFELDGKKYFSMVPQYTPDHGHLNEYGRKVVAEQLLVFLAELGGY